jgi:hypothetical protein
MPFVTLAAETAAFLYIPVLGGKAVFSFSGDIILFCIFYSTPLANSLRLVFERFCNPWRRTDSDSDFAYEVPLFISVLAPTYLRELVDYRNGGFLQRTPIIYPY